MQGNNMQFKKADLSADELILLDVLFDKNVPINRLIKGENFLLSFNCSSHNLDLQELMKVIEKFVNNGLMKLTINAFPGKNQFETYIGLTEKGGLLWEQERLPIWVKYVCESTLYNNGFCELSVYSPSLKTAKDFIEISQECNLYEFLSSNDFKISEVQKKEAANIIPWKNFDQLFKITSQLSTRMDSEKGLDTDWDLYKVKMKFWRNVEELQIVQNR